MQRINFCNLIYPSNKVPLSFIQLNDWSCIRIDGVDNKKYLQGQITINLDLLPYNKHIFCAHCNINGKIWSTFHLFYCRNSYMYIERTDVSLIQIFELKKYSIFSEVIIRKDNDVLLFGIVGNGSRQILKNFFLKLPDKDNSVICHKSAILLWFNSPLERFMLIIKKNNLMLSKIINCFSQISTSDQWLSLDIESGFSIISKMTTNKCSPLSVNLENLNGIDFNKGCYFGQESIAKIKFKSANKQSLFWLISCYPSTIIPKIGSLIELDKENNWYIVGYVLIAISMYNGYIWIQAVLHKNIDLKSNLRIFSEVNNLFFVHKKF
ncbi:tRNA-modifying protein YgfZ [Buchnera aphidicola]|uniref:tRNA-modifying protein YgfZ n=1 Tax=Buchnera aphidicola TaxID=9 RepID=UPI0031B8738B